MSNSNCSRGLRGSRGATTIDPDPSLSQPDAKSMSSMEKTSLLVRVLASALGRMHQKHLDELDNLTLENMSREQIVMAL